MRLTLLAASVCLLAWVVPAAAAPPACKVMVQKDFAGDGEVVKLAKGEGLADAAALGIFRAPLAVNTDGAPNSYHPKDFLGTELAINRIDNGIAIRRTDGRRLTTDQKIAAFKSWRDTGWVVPEGFFFSWKNVIAATPDGHPCVFTSGDHEGYFGSLTALQNGLSDSAAGECQVANQLDQRFVPAIVLRGDSNPLKDFGARTGDLVLAINPESGVTVPAIIGDAGDGNRIGEGSVALNMALLGRTDQPETYGEALRLDTGNKSMVVAVIPGSRRFERATPYSAENLSARISSWAGVNGYGDQATLAATALKCAGGL